MDHSSKNRNDSDYRPGVGIFLLNRAGMVFVGERLDNPGAWQMPQGGIDAGEDLTLAIFRELEEEAGTRNARILAMMDEWLYYDFPERLSRRLWDGRWRGQRQKWVALEFLGDDSEIRLDTHAQPEFRQWKWVPCADLLSCAVPFKRGVYAQVMEAFAALTARPSVTD